MVSRRESIFGLAGAPLFGLAGGAAAAKPGADAAAPFTPAYARNFAVTGVYINAAYTHPLPLEASEAIAQFIAGRIDPASVESKPRISKSLFAKLINASPEEIAWVPSTSYGESFVAGAIGLKSPSVSGKVVTDILHFDGSLYAYGELAKQGLNLVVLPMGGDGRIDMNRLEAAVDEKTRLVAVSLVSMVNGFQHDLKTVCDIAHRKGALVYADIIQAAGAVPIDVKASGVDFAACSSFKWLMGDFGCGFLYVNRDVFPRLQRTEFGYHQVKTLAYHALPGDKPGGPLFESTPDDATAAGFFEVGSIGLSAEAAVTASLKTLLRIGPEQIQKRRQPLINRLMSGLGARYRPLTPQGSTSPIVTFALEGAQQLGPRLAKANISIQLYDNRFRISPSVYNTPADVELLLSVLLA